MAKKNRALVSQEAQALIQEVMSNSLVTHHFHRCPEFQKQFLEHLKGCPVHREEMDALRSRAKEWAVDMRRKLFGLYAIRGPKVEPLSRETAFAQGEKPLGNGFLFICFAGMDHVLNQCTIRFHPELKLRHYRSA